MISGDGHRGYFTATRHVGCSFQLKHDLPLAHQNSPIAVHGLLEAHGGRDQNIQFPGFDALQRADVQIGLLCQPFLGQAGRHPLAAHIGTENFQLSRDFSLYWHGALHSFSGLT
jgi:hypothetical protein